jgi:FtsZ-interacting cell division protein ZipA
MTVEIVVIAVVIAALLALAAWQLRGRRREAVAGRERRKAEILRERAREQQALAGEAEAKARELDGRRR